MLKLQDYEELRFAICECYAWPVVVPIYQSGGTKVQNASCGRCRKAPTLLSSLILSIEEAREVFFENYGHEVEPI